ncbi:hypothetical protein KC334_g13106, partial [Hortaea werneckii]
WWGETFVTELTRISEQAEQKLKVRRQSLMDPAQTVIAEQAARRNDSAQPDETNKVIGRQGAKDQVQRNLHVQTIAEEAALHSDSSEDDGLMIGGQQEQKET